MESNDEADHTQERWSCSSLEKYSFRNLLDEFTKVEEDSDGAPLTTSSVGLPQTGDDAFIGKTYSNLEGATKGYAYDHSSKKKKKWKKKRKKY